MTITLQRLFETADGTFGRLTVPGRTFFTIERRHDGDHPRIPAGSYPLKLGMFYHGDGPGGKPDYPAYEIIVPGREAIKIHIANTADQLLGCVAPGETIGCVGMKVGVWSSTHAFNDFMLTMGGKKDDWIVIYDPAQ